MMCICQVLYCSYFQVFRDKLAQVAIRSAPENRPARKRFNLLNCINLLSKSFTAFILSQYGKFLTCAETTLLNQCKCSSCYTMCSVWAKVTWHYVPAASFIGFVYQWWIFIVLQMQTSGRPFCPLPDHAGPDRVLPSLPASVTLCYNLLITSK